MSEAFLLAAAVLSCYLGLAWLALAMDAHWQQLRGGQTLSSATQRRLRGLGVIFVLGSLGLCLAADHPSMAALVWLMALAAAALALAFTFSWRPQWLRPLLAAVRC